MHAESVVKLVKVVSAALLVALCGCGSSRSSHSVSAGRIELTSPTLMAGERIPRAFTCDGADVAPPLRLSAAPRGTASLALLMTDPDAGGFAHWLVFDLPPTTRALGQGVLPRGARQGRNGFGAARYGGPCPPRGAPAHRYVLALYALAHPLQLPNAAPADQVEAAVRGDSLAVGELVGHYGR